MATLPYIDDYAETCSRHPNAELGYQQWLKNVAAWGYDTTQVYEGELVWSKELYNSMWDNTNSVESANLYVKAYIALNNL